MKHEHLNYFEQALSVGMYQVRANSNFDFQNSILTITAQYLLSQRYFDGRGVARDKQERIRLIRAAALQNYARAQFSLGECYRDGIGVEKTRLMAACLFKMAADNGYQRASDKLNEFSLNKVIARCDCD